jgi:oral-facial-digital syndrome 1 protein
MERVQVERSMPFKTLEERMMKYKAECDLKYQNDLEKEIQRLKDFEVSKIRMEEAQKYRSKLTQFTEEMEKLHLEKVKELKTREQETVLRIKEKERQVEQVAYEHRQKVMKDEELLRYREADVKKTMEMELLMVKQERDKCKSLQGEYEGKLAEMTKIKTKLEKNMSEELSNFKANYQRQFQDKDFEIHRRNLAVDEDENRVKL